MSTLFDFEETPSGVTQLQIAGTNNGKIEISAWHKQKLVSRKIYSKGNEQYSCSSKGVEIPIGRIEKSGAEAEGGILYLNKSRDGALVIERKTSAGGYSLLYIPMVSSSYEWYRFKPLER